MKKQHAFALLTAQAHAMLDAQVVQPTGNFVTVRDNDGNEVAMPELHGGFVSIGELLLDGVPWRAVLGCGLDVIFAQMITQIQQANAAAGAPVGALLAIVDDMPGSEEPDYSQLDVAVDEATLQNVNAWLDAHDFAQIVPETMRNLVEMVCELFRVGFQIGQDSIS